ncbi:related to potassium transporter TRK-1 [Rhynchosporium graminicola]|uniref:Related to potassium transporter TRK-1 n=1 Tax=Rhynchosporium graminicola TaxID=2792576 RepID=A0A1E1LBI0_9HELO|nr:related to potassium transporter TRK-1 [Rhynchosporium commune]
MAIINLKKVQLWLPEMNFFTLHYAYIIFAGIFGFIVIYPYGNMPAIDAYFFGASASTESGLNTVDVKQMKTYQQLVIYFIPIITQMGFINIITIAVRLYWFEKKLKEVAPLLFSRRGPIADSVARSAELDTESQKSLPKEQNTINDDTVQRAAVIRFAADPRLTTSDSKAIHVPSPRERDQGFAMSEIDTDVINTYDDDEDNPKKSSSQPREPKARSMSKATSIERVTSSMFVIGSSQARSQSRAPGDSRGVGRTELDLPRISSQATVGRNSQFFSLLLEDREQLGGIEYRALKLLLKICIGYVLGLHLFGAICLVGWIQYAPDKYTDYLASTSQNKIWWAFYSAQTMVDNLGFTLTPDSMISFNDATFPLLIMTFLAFAGHNFSPVFLRLVIWLMAKLSPKKSSIQESLQFLLEHPRRCCTLLFPSGPTWILFGILFALNLVDVILIVTLDLENETLTVLPLGPRILAAIFQAASARHTGTATFNLATVNPAVQFSLLVMMYISVYPIAIAIRASNTYEERSLGIFPGELKDYNEEAGVKSYVMTHLRNQLSFDLWYIFLGIFCVCVAEADRIMDAGQSAFAVFPVFFEVTSAYGNVGLSLGHPDVNTSLTGQFTTFSKLVICAMMIRGRHRGLPYQLDRAILLPNEELGDEGENSVQIEDPRRMEATRMYRDSEESESIDR